MRGQELLDTMGGIDERYIEAASKSPRRKTPVWLRITAAAACVCLLVGGVWQGLRWYEFHSTMLEGGAVSRPQNGFSTSDTYATLSDLLTDLSDGEEHNTLRGDGGVEIEATASQAAALTEGQNAVVYQHYSYHLAGGQVMISDLSAQTPQAVGTIDCDVTAAPREEAGAHGIFDSLFLCGDRLITVGQIHADWSTVYYTAVAIYSLADPVSPSLLCTWVQLGSLTHVYMTGDDLMLMTADGVCACGWSRLKDTDDYVPQLTENGEAVAWTDEELHVLGTPSLVQYLAVTRIDTATATIKDKHAFYGWVMDVYYGADWFLLDVIDDHNQYAFSVGETITYTGSFGMPDEAFATTSVFSVTKDGDIFRVLGEYRTGRGGNMKTQLLAMTVNMKKGTSYYTTRGLEDEKWWTITEIILEKDRAVVAVDLNASEYKSRFFFAEFHGMSVSLYADSLEADRVLDDHWFWGGEKTLIPMGNDIYLRPSGSDRDYPNELDIFDFSRSRAPVCVYASEGELSNACFGYLWTVYDQNTVGILIENADENGEYRFSTYSWRIYRVDVNSSAPFTKLASYDLEAKETPSQSISQFASFEYEGEPYITACNMTVPLKVEW